MTNATLLRRVLAILSYAYPDAGSIEVSIEAGALHCVVDGRIVPAPRKEAYA